jgi:hypothetical protein
MPFPLGWLTEEAFPSRSYAVPSGPGYDIVGVEEDFGLDVN